ncbi:STAS domain-containing protein [Micromonosporaceae bacterium Da 78-11]
MPADAHGTFVITLTPAVQQIGEASPHTIAVDLAGVTFGGSTLVNFLARAHQSAPSGCRLLLSRPTPMIRTVLRITRMAEIATVSGIVHG